MKYNLQKLRNFILCKHWYLYSICLGVAHVTHPGTCTICTASLELQASGERTYGTENKTLLYHFSFIGYRDCWEDIKRNAYIFVSTAEPQSTVTSLRRSPTVMRPVLLIPNAHCTYTIYCFIQKAVTSILRTTATHSCPWVQLSIQSQTS